MDPTGVVTVISLLSAVGGKPALLHAWRKNELVDGEKDVLTLFAAIIRNAVDFDLIFDHILICEDSSAWYICVV